jgi:hypothetical protein
MHEHGQDQAHGDHSKEKTMPREVARSIIGTERETGNDTSKVSEADMHGNTDGSLRCSSNIVPVPSDAHRNVGIDSLTYP